ncbi:hypothetical protein [Nocardia iowensis]|uniref:DUF4282 domain-containing protein n=1 Tax=Nocardia iowensis TaxID=204891 RepID=A0ABX8S293_NOCIO|nr:hypothetical protein [Nocardia iowensis]QXN96144.1 hypothetical protein KV110_09945 [Nocardia iowensis]
MHRIAGWWDSFELWVAGLPFIPQFLVVLVGMVPVSFAIAYLLDRALRLSLRVLDRKHGVEQALPTVPDTLPAELTSVDARPTVQSGVR